MDRRAIDDGRADGGERRPGSESLAFRRVSPAEEELLADLFADLDPTYFRPHPLTPEAAAAIVRYGPTDVYAILTVGETAVAYGLLRGWTEGYATPSLGVAVRMSEQRRGYGREMMQHLERVAAERGAPAIRLRVHADNARARRLYESLGYRYEGEDRGELVMTIDLPADRGSQR